MAPAIDALELTFGNLLTFSNLRTDELVFGNLRTDSIAAAIDALSMGIGSISGLVLNPALQSWKLLPFPN